MYLTLRPPWAGDPGAVPPTDAGVAAPPPSGSGSAVPRGPRRPRVRRPAPAEVADPGGSDAVGDAVIELRAADRALEWRGDAVALPPRQLDLGPGGDGGSARPLDDGEIQAGLSAHHGAVRACVVEAATGTDLRATLAVELLIDGAGRVGRSRVQAPRYLFERGLLACVRRALGRLRFPATGAPTKVGFPVQLG